MVMSLNYTQLMLSIWILYSQMTNNYNWIASLYKGPHARQFYCQFFHIVQSYWSCMGGIDAKILY